MRHASPLSDGRGRVRRLRQAVNDPQWVTHASGLAAIAYGMVFGTLVQILTAPFGGGGGPHEPLPLLAGIAGLVYGTLALPRGEGDADGDKPSFRNVMRSGTVPRSRHDVAELQHARRVVWVIGAYAAAGVLLALAAPVQALEAWFVAGNGAAVWWWYRSCRAGRRARKAAALTASSESPARVSG